MGRIRAIYTDTGHWLARCNHDTGVIELNRRDFPRLSPLMKDYIWVHEYVHLLYGVYDEDRCNAITDEIFVRRGKTASKRQARINFIDKSKGSASVSGLSAETAVDFGINHAVNTIINYINDLSYNAAAFERNKNSGFNALSEDAQREVIDSYLRQSFRLARRSSDRSAYSFFMGKMKPLMTPLEISSYGHLVSKYDWILDDVYKYEQEYGVGFMEVTPADYTDIWLVLAVTAVVLVGIVYLVKKYKKH
ncbi:MAG: hypothetical protein J6T81_06155 [Bacteroidales bacterium]|nr:hypothetical protein [Bacteroidales bacterium]